MTTSFATPNPTAPAQRLTVPRHSAADLSYADFLQEFVNQNRPVVIMNAAHAWPARDKWTPQYFKDRFGPLRINVSYREKMEFASFIDAVMASREDAPGPYMYRLFIGPHLPELLPDLEPQNPYAFPRRLASPLMRGQWKRPDGYLKLLIGGTGGRFPVLHYDTANMHAAITEIYGQKEFVLYPPEDSTWLYPKPAMPNQSQIEDIRRCDAARFPLFANATQHHTVLQPGDMIFVPSRWWHAARALTPSISICQNMLDGSNWKGYVDEICSPHEAGTHPLKRWLKKTYLSNLGALLSRLERHRLPGADGHDWKARMAPVSSADCGHSSEWPVSRWKVN
jgi:hypothetical protein